MRITTFFIALGTFCATAGTSHSQNARVVINKANTPLSNILEEIESQTDYLFIYNNEIDASSKVTVKVNNKPVSEVLSNLLDDTDISYAMEGSNIVLANKAQITKQTTQQQTGIKITGKVKDALGEPLIGVSIGVKGTSMGVTTDLDGNFMLNVPNGQSVLVFSYIGYLTQEKTVGNSREFAITMAENTQMLDELVVIGYGVQKKVNLSGAVQAVSGKELEDRPITNVNQGLQGLAPNMNITISNGRATSAPDINIRGYTSINGGSAFILVDNIPVSSDELSRINPADIESISVLKDASSSAIYGARAAFGVVLVTTKKAKGNKLVVNFDANYATRTLGDVPQIVTDPYTVMDVTHQAGVPLYNIYPESVRDYARQRSADLSLPAVIVDPTNPNAWAYYGTTDWMSEAFRSSAPTYTANLSVAKNDEKLSYRVSAGYYQQDGMIRYGNDVLKRYNFRGNGTYQFTNWWKVGSNVAFNYSDYNSPSYLDGNFFWEVNRKRSLSVPRNPDGTWSKDGATILGAMQEGGKKANKLNETQLSFNTQIDLIKDVLSFNADANYRWTNNGINMYNLPIYYRTGPDQPMQTFMSNVGSNSFAQNQTVFRRYSVYNAYADFHKTFAGKHFLQAMVGYNQEYTYIDNYRMRREQLVSTSLPTAQLATGTMTTTESINDLALQSVFGRINYVYDEKYILEFSARRDGTSRYPKNNRWGTFPSGSAAWVVSNESFMNGIKEAIRMDVLKLRGSYGVLGNQILLDSDGNPVYYPYIPTMSSGTTGVILDGVKPLYVTKPGVVAADLTWETVRKLNIGVDLAFFNNKLDVTAEVFRHDTKDMLTKSKELPAVFGATEPKTNAADLKTKGWELNIGWKDEYTVAGSPMFLSARFMISDSRAWITKYENENRLLSDYYKGQEIGEMWGFITEGFFQSQEDVDNSPSQRKIGTDDVGYKFYAGDIKLKDLNGDNEISKGDNTVDNPGDRKIIGNNRARLPFSIDLAANWKGFDVRALFYGIGKRDWYPSNGSIYFWGVYAQPWTNVLKEHMDHWTPENPNAYWPRIKAYAAEDNQMELAANQTKYMQDASFMRFKNLTVGYTLPESALRKTGLSKLRFYVSAENLFTISHLKVNLDPEGLNGEGAYPFQQTYSVGVNVSF